MLWVDLMEREMRRRHEEDVAPFQMPIRLPRVDPWLIPPRKRAEGLYFSEQIRHTNGAQPRHT